jgi:hypothetical protein
MKIPFSMLNGAGGKAPALMALLVGLVLITALKQGANAPLPAANKPAF